MTSAITGGALPSRRGVPKASSRRRACDRSPRKWTGFLRCNERVLQNMIEAELARSVMQRIEALAQISDEPGRLTRTFCSPAMRRANELVGAWMREAGMEIRQDAIGNLIGHYRSIQPEGKILLFGSHLDTVRDAGKFDGALGVLLAIACVQRLHESKKRLPFAIEIIGFADEEGVRYQSAYLGSKVVAGSFNVEDLKRMDPKG